MSSLSPEARARLVAFRRAESPDPEVVERCLAAVERRVAAAPEVAGRSRRVIVGAAILALAAGLLLALRWASAPTRRAEADGMGAPYHDARAPGHEVRDAGATAGAIDAASVGVGPTAQDAASGPGVVSDSAASDSAASDSAGPAGSRDASDSAGPAGSRGASDSGASDSAGSASATAGSRVAGDSVEGDGSRVAGDSAGAGADSPRAARDGEPVPDPRARRRGADDIAAEVALLREAKLAAPARRLELLAAHARRFPGGAFAAEAALLEIEARCELGEAAQARTLAARFARRFAGSPLAARAARVCAETGAPAP